MVLLDEGTACANNSWYLVHCQPKKEAYAAKSLRHLLKLHVFLPESQVRWRGEVKRTPFFPGYLFMLADLQTVPASAINACPGVLRLVEFGGYLQSIPHSVIESIRQRLEQLNRGDLLPCHHFSPGDAVRIKCGPLQDLSMVFVGPTTSSQRVQVLLEFLGRQKEVQVDVEMLERAPKNTLSTLLDRKPVRVRYTRGKGRKIAAAQK